MKNQVGREVIEGLSEFVAALEKDEVISEKFTCRTVTLDLHPQPYSPKAVKATRSLLQVSQGVFAQFLGVFPKTIRAWEQGRGTPSDMACRFLDEIQRDPEYGRARLKEAIRIRQACN